MVRRVWDRRGPDRSGPSCSGSVWNASVWFGPKGRCGELLHGGGLFRCGNLRSAMVVQGVVRSGS